MHIFVHCLSSYTFKASLFYSLAFLQKTQKCKLFYIFSFILKTTYFPAFPLYTYVRAQRKKSICKNMTANYFFNLVFFN